MGDMPELKPCPFCGGEAELELDNDHHGEWFNLGCINHWGRLDPDDACLGGRLFYTEDLSQKDAAITAWNTRVIDLDAIRAQARAEALREAAELVGREAADFPDNVAWCVEDLANAILALIDTPADPVREAARVEKAELVKARDVLDYYLHHPALGKETAMKRRTRELLDSLRALAGND